MKVEKLKFEVHNHMEDVVAQFLDVILSRISDVCVCPQCMGDMVANTLNRLRPQYAPNSDNMEEKIPLEVADALIAAIKTVHSKPNHDDPHFVKERYRLHNFCENVVAKAMQDILGDDPKANTEPNFLAEIAAASLNEMRPRYAFTPKGTSIVRTEEVKSDIYADAMSIVYKHLKRAKQPDESVDTNDALDLDLELDLDL